MRLCTWKYGTLYAILEGYWKKKISISKMIIKLAFTLYYIKQAFITQIFYPF